MQTTHRIVVLILDGALPLDVGIPAQIFQQREALPLPYSLELCGAQPGLVASNDGLSFHVENGLEALERADTIIVPGYRPAQRELDDAVLRALRAAHERGTRLASICTGAFALAAAGVLDGLRATTHWRHAESLARLHPLVDVDADVLFVDNGQVLTSAGVAAGIDLCLHLVRRDFGVRLSNQIAQYLVAAPYRSGGQSQYVPRSIPTELDDLFAETRAWALTRLQDALTVADLARHAKVSPRTFARRFVEDTGYTPLQWVLRARVDLARELLESTDRGVDQISAEVGLGTGANLRMHFQRILGTSPSDYRRSFAGRVA